MRFLRTAFHAAQMFRPRSALRVSQQPRILLFEIQASRTTTTNSKRNRIKSENNIYERGYIDSTSNCYGTLPYIDHPMVQNHQRHIKIIVLLRSTPNPPRSIFNIFKI